MILFKLGKALKIEALYELMAASLASFFRCRCYEDVKKDLNFTNDSSQVSHESDTERKFSWLFNEMEKMKEIL